MFEGGNKIKTPGNNPDIFAVVVAMIGASVFMFTGDIVKDTRVFLTALKNDDTAKADTYLSNNFLEGTFIDEFKNYFDIF